MPANTFGELFRVTTFGESHGAGLGGIIDGCPPQIELSEEDIQPLLDCLCARLTCSVPSI